MSETRVPERVRTPPGRPRVLGYQPALDGVRALAVVLVVLFHLDVGVFSGGYLGVSVFFTLSGFLITTLLLERHRDVGDLGLRGFYVRRIKRLVPASAATLLAVVAVTAGGGFMTTSRTRGDLVTSALNVFNWREVASGRSYADLFVGDSPVAHFWSLAIEEQFYVVWPVAMLMMLRSERIGAARLLSAVSALFVASAVAAQFASSQVAYFASWTRAAEILGGAWLAIWLVRAGRVPAWWRRLASPAIVLVILLGLVTPAASGWAYSGGLPFFSIVSVALIAGLQAPGPARRALSLTPLVALGRISYGVYLVHWPVFVFIDESRIGVDGWNLAVTRLALTAILATAMYLLVERPIRTSTRALPANRVVGLALGTALGIVAVASIWVDTPRSVADAAPPVLIAAAPIDTPAAPTTRAPTTLSPATPSPAPRAPTTSPSPTTPSPTTGDTVATTSPPPAAAVTDEFVPAIGSVAARARLAADDDPADDAATDDAATDDAATDEAETGATATAAAPTTETADLESSQTTISAATGDTTTIAVFGDSVPAWLMRDAARAFARRDVVLVNAANEACDGAVDLAVGRDRRGTELRPPPDCLEWTESYPTALASYDRPIEVGLLVIGQVATVDRRFGGDWKHPCDAMGWYVADVGARIDFLRAEGLEPVIALPARFGTKANFILPDDHAERIGCVRTALAGLGVDRGVDTVDLDGLLCAGDDCDGRRRRDGIHVDPEVASDVLDELVDLTLDARR